MKYVYYPGCSLKSSGRPYEDSLLEVLRAAGLDVEELAGWNCCGATAYMSVDESDAMALAGRNLALAEKGRPKGKGEVIDMIAPCSACYLVLMKAKKQIEDEGHLGQAARFAFSQAGLEYRGKVRVRHPLDVLAHDVGPERVKELTRKPLKGLKVACYYGCQVVRPYATFDDQFNPMTMDHLLRAAGAETLEWNSMKARCCGGTFTGTIENVGLRLSYIILKEAKRLGADMLATACPLCQFNVECYQGSMRKRFKDDLNLPSLYFSQLLGYAMGIDPKQLCMDDMLVSPDEALATCGA
jgi:heterodisulfide reductase subunit B